MADAPADPLMAHTANRMAEMAGQTAKNMAAREMRSWAKQYVPRMFWPLIPGEGGSVEANMKAGVSRWFWGLVWSAVFSIVFFGIFAIAIVGFLAITGFAVLTSM
jgi:hypothetical protein